MGQEIVWYGTAGAVLIQWSAGADALVSHVRFVFLHGLLGWQAEDRYGAECAFFHLLFPYYTPVEPNAPASRSSPRSSTKSAYIQGAISI